MPVGGDWKDLFAAVQRGDLDTVRYYILMGIDPNYQHPEYLTSPIIESFREGQLEIAEYLLKNGATANVKEIWTGQDLLSIVKATKNKAALALIKQYL